MAEITLKLHDMGSRGDAVARHEGRVVFVPLGIPGETVRVKLVHEESRYARAEILEVLEPAAERVPPPCPYFGVCGSCQWQHIAYDAQLDLKRQIVHSQLTRYGKQESPDVRPVLGMDEPWAYRNHVQLAVDPQGKLGYQALKSHEVVPVEACLITHPLLDEVWEAFDLEIDTLTRVSLRVGIATGEQLVMFEGQGDLPVLETDLPVSCLYKISDEEIVVMAGQSYYHEQLLERAFRISGPSFFQVNTLQAERLLETMLDYLAPVAGDRVLDAYCGVGTWALSLAPYVESVVGIESSSWAIEDAVANTAEDEGVDFIYGDVEQVLASMNQTFNAVILDPPRAGCGPQVLQALAQVRPDRMIYMSCDPGALARDVAQLDALGYDLVQVQPVDVFPQTFHLECVALLRASQGVIEG